MNILDIMGLELNLWKIDKVMERQHLIEKMRCYGYKVEVIERRGLEGDRDFSWAEGF